MTDEETKQRGGGSKANVDWKEDIVALVKKVNCKYRDSIHEVRRWLTSCDSEVHERHKFLLDLLLEVFLFLLAGKIDRT